jgi:CPA2 family monovalent cation:H+ antiporter-2
MQIPLLNDIVTIFVLSVAVIFICYRIKIPVIVGFILSGILAGPYGMKLIAGVHEVEVLAEIGVVLLLFTIGLEFSLSSLMRIKKAVFIGGALQVVLSIAGVYGLVRLLGRPFNQALFFGFLIALSSTAVVLKLLQENRQMETPHGRNALAILIFQDIAVVPMMLAVPVLAGGGAGSDEPLWMLGAKAVGIILLIIIAAKWVVPMALYQVSRTRSQELFLLTISAICLGTAWLTSSSGLSLALGAFLAGLIISESEYSHQALGNILPFRDVFTSFFFVSIGMLLDVFRLVQNPLWILLAGAGVLIFKSAAAALAAVLIGCPFRTAVLVGLSLAQVGEFSFILSKVGLDQGVISQQAYQFFLSFSVLTIGVTPFVIKLSPRLAGLLAERLPLPDRLKGLSSEPETHSPQEENHLVIIGYGVNGRNVAKAASLAGIPYIILEMNPDTVRREHAKGVPIYYGDASQEVMLEYVKIESARVVVVAINDPAATRRIVQAVRRLAPRARLIVRTRFVDEMKGLYDLGADEVVPEEFETSVEIFSRVLSRYLIPRDEIEKFVAEIRSGGYQMFRSLAKNPTMVTDLKLDFPDVEISAIRISEKSPLDGKTLAEIELRKKYGVSALAIRRGKEIVSNPEGSSVLYANDVVFILGTKDKTANVCRMGSCAAAGKER